MQIENIEALRLWLPSFIAPMSDADPNALAKYVLALVKKDKSEDELKDLCQDQLEVFFREGTKNFVEKLFEAIQNKYYLANLDPGNRSRPDADQLSDIPSEPAPLPTATTATIQTIKPQPATAAIKLVPVNPEIKELKRPTHPSHSRSRSPIGKPRNHDDRRGGRKYSDEEKRRRRPALGNARRNNDYKDRRHSNDEKPRGRERGRTNRNHGSRSRSNSWNRSRSRSKSWSDRSRSRSWSRSPDRATGTAAPSRQENGQFSNPVSIADGSDKDYRMNLPPTAPEIKEAPNNKADKFPKAMSKRCRDFDEKGYCMRGELCPYDHGTDPVVVEDMSILRFGGTNNNQQQPPIPASHHITQAPVIPPAPPPPPPPESYIPEPYNPEAPGMERPLQRPPQQQPPFWIPPAITSLPPPPPLGIRPPQLPPSQIQVVPSQVYLGPPPPIPIPRTRELIGVPTIDDRMNQGPMGMIHNKPLNTELEMIKAELPPPIPHPQFVPHKPVMPSHIAFARNFRSRPYGRKFPQGNHHHRGFLSDKCTLELRKVPTQQNTILSLNNHFSKFGTIINLQVNYDGDQEAALIQFSSNQEAMSAYKCTEAVFNNRFIKLFWHNKDNAAQKGQQTAAQPGSVKERLGDGGQALDNGVASKNGTATNSNNQANTGSDANNVPSPAPLNRPMATKGSLSLNNNKPQPKLTKEKKEANQKKIADFQDKKSKMLHEKIDQQKKLIDLLSKCKSEKEKASIKEMIENLSTSINALQLEMKSTFQEMGKNASKAPGGATVVPKSKNEMQKMLLDTELDLYNKQHSGDDTSELLRKLNSLKHQASRLGLIPSGGKPSTRGRRGALSYRGRGGGSATRVATNIDRRPKKLFIKGDEVNMKKVHSLFNMDNAEITKDGTIVTFKSYSEAEKVKTIISSQPISQHISVSLYFDKSQVSKEELNPNEIIMSEEEDPGDLELFDEEEEEDEIGRSWRR